MRQLTLDELRQVLRECAGEADAVDLDGDIGDRQFTDLGYDSLAVLETAGRLERSYGIELPEELVTDIETPDELIGLVNNALAGAR